MHSPRRAARDVIGVDHTEARPAPSFGADEVIDYTREDFTRDGERYDLIFDVPPTIPWSDCRHALTPDGAYVLIGHDHYGAANGRWIGSMGRFLALLVVGHRS